MTFQPPATHDLQRDYIDGNAGYPGHAEWVPVEPSDIEAVAVDVSTCVGGPHISPRLTGSDDDLWLFLLSLISGREPQY